MFAIVRIYNKNNKNKDINNVIVPFRLNCHHVSYIEDCLGSRYNVMFSLMDIDKNKIFDVNIQNLWSYALEGNLIGVVDCGINYTNFVAIDIRIFDIFKLARPMRFESSVSNILDYINKDSIVVYNDNISVTCSDFVWNKFKYLDDNKYIFVLNSDYSFYNKGFIYTRNNRLFYNIFQLYKEIFKSGLDLSKVSRIYIHSNGNVLTLFLNKQVLKYMAKELILRG